ncbi:NAD kinase [Nakamurella lactea]|uniref:NAD kinase n=1 Tax=Nakamurella lactea TaxID=459515 RepID=UPI00040335FE|nr:NAD kinase [Nakamurella lactea]
MTSTIPPTVGREQAERRVLLVAHTGRADIREVVTEAADRLAEAGVTLVALPDEGPDLGLAVSDDRPVELVLALGGDGTLLRAAEQARPLRAGVLGVNLGRVGFLAEVDADHIDAVLDAIVARSYRLVDRMTVDVAVEVAGEIVYTCWALNEISVEKSSRERILDVVVEVDGHGLSAYGCDGVLISTPTGSTAYAFSAGGPIVWPAVEALLVAPLNAHALFARAAVVGPDSTVTVHLDPDGHDGTVACDGRRSFDAPPGSRVHVRRGVTPVALARIGDEQFTDRLVRKFALPVHGWRDQRH